MKNKKEDKHIFVVRKRRLGMSEKTMLILLVLITLVAIFAHYGMGIN